MEINPTNARPCCPKHGSALGRGAPAVAQRGRHGGATRNAGRCEADAGVLQIAEEALVVREQ